MNDDRQGYDAEMGYYDECEHNKNPYECEICGIQRKENQPSNEVVDESCLAELYRKHPLYTEKPKDEPNLKCSICGEQLTISEHLHNALCEHRLKEIFIAQDKEIKQLKDRLDSAHTAYLAVTGELNKLKKDNRHLTFLKLDMKKIISLAKALDRRIEGGY